MAHGILETAASLLLKAVLIQLDYPFSRSLTSTFLRIFLPYLWLLRFSEPYRLTELPLQLS